VAQKDATVFSSPHLHQQPPPKSGGAIRTFVPRQCKDQMPVLEKEQKTSLVVEMVAERSTHLLEGHKSSAVTAVRRCATVLLCWETPTVWFFSKPSRSNCLRITTACFRGTVIAKHSFSVPGHHTTSLYYCIFCREELKRYCSFSHINRSAFVFSPQYRPELLLASEASVKTVYQTISKKKWITKKSIASSAFQLKPKR